MGFINQLIPGGPHLVGIIAGYQVAIRSFGRRILWTSHRGESSDPENGASSSPRSRRHSVRSAPPETLVTVGCSWAMITHRDLMRLCRQLQKITRNVNYLPALKHVYLEGCTPPQDISRCRFFALSETRPPRGIHFIQNDSLGSRDGHTFIMSSHVPLLQGLLNVPFWVYWTSPYSSHYRPYT